MCIGSCSVNSFAYAGDVNLLCTTVAGLQRLIDICTNYADKGRFSFGIKKTKCIESSRKILGKEVIWYLKCERIDNVDFLEKLVVIFGLMVKCKCIRGFRNVEVLITVCAVQD